MIQHRIGSRLLAFACLALACGCGGGGSGPGGSSGDNKPSDKDWPTVTVTEEQLIKEWVANKDEARKKYTRTLLQVSGTVSSVSEDTGGDVPVVQLHGYTDPKDRFASVVCAFAAGDQKALELVKGQKVTIKGKWAEFGTGVPLMDCTVVAAEKSPALTIGADDLAKEVSANAADAEKKYADKPVIVEGVVADVKSELQNGKKQNFKFTLETKDKPGVVSVFCSSTISGKLRAELDKVQKGQKIKASGVAEVYVTDPKIIISQAVLLK